MPEYDSSIRWLKAGVGYQVSNHGDVWSCRASREWFQLKARPLKGGHLQVWNGGRLRLVHHLVLEAFVGPCPEGMECRHLDGNPTNNRLENICWGTHTENMADMIAHGKTTRGERHGGAKLTREQVLAIRSAYASGVTTQKELGKRYGVGATTISDIINRKSWI